MTTLSSYRPPAGQANPAETRSAVSLRARTNTKERLALVMPALREAASLGPLLERVRSVFATLDMPWEVLVVDDDSGDGTGEIVSAMTREDARVRLLVRTQEKGLSGAVLHGWQHTDATILGVMDADGQHPPELLPVLLARILEGRDAAIGSRFVQGATASRWNPLRWLISTAATWPARSLQCRCLRVKDPLSGFFLVRRHCVENVLFQPAGFKLLLEILVRGRLGSVDEVPFAFAQRTAGRSKVSLKVVWDYVALLLRLYRARIGTAGVPQVSSGD
jgi:dolichol-phosphate mannosyltransferase